MFFEKYGHSVVQSTDNIWLISGDEDICYHIGQFILQEQENHSPLVDNFVELLQGYFVSMAFSLHAENSNIKEAPFSDTIFFLDTNVLLGCLGFRTTEINQSTKQTIESLQAKGAKFACFTYNYDEVYNILEAYKWSCASEFIKSSQYTLEYFDQFDKPKNIVNNEQALLLVKFRNLGIEIVQPFRVLAEFKADTITEGILDERKLEEIIRSENPKYNDKNLSDDLIAINTVSRVRCGQKFNFVEHCRAVFITTNTLLVRSTAKLLHETCFDIGFPLVITLTDLSVVAWIKDFCGNNNLPAIHLLIDAYAAVNPSSELISSFLKTLEAMIAAGNLKEEDAVFICWKNYYKKELMIQTHGGKFAISEEIVYNILGSKEDDIKKKLLKEQQVICQQEIDKDREKMESEHQQQLKIMKEHIISMQSRAESFERKNAELENRIKIQNRKITDAYKKVTIEVNKKYEKKEQNLVFLMDLARKFMAVGFVIAYFVSLNLSDDPVVNFGAMFVAILTTSFTALDLWKKNFCLTKIARWFFKDRKKKELIRKQEELNKIFK